MTASRKSTDRLPSEAEQIVALAERSLEDFLADRGRGEDAVRSARAKLPAMTIGLLEKLVGRPDSYRDALLVALAAHHRERDACGHH